MPTIAEQLILDARPCVFLVAASDHRKEFVGQIIAVRPVGHVWGRMETTPAYIEVKTPLPISEGVKYLEHKKLGLENDGLRRSFNRDDVAVALAVGDGSLDVSKLTRAAFDAKIIDRGA